MSVSSISDMIIRAQDDSDTVVLPNACPGELVAFEDSADVLVRCFSVLTRQPHMIPPENWSLVNTPDPMPAVEDQSLIADDRILVDHVTCGIIGDNAMQLRFDDDGALRSIRLLPPGKEPAQQQWEAQAKRMLEG